MKEQMINLQYETKALDVTEKGIVTVGVNGIGIEDAQHDISMPGSFTDTLRDDISKCDGSSTMTHANFSAFLCLVRRKRTTSS